MKIKIIQNLENKSMNKLTGGINLEGARNI